jgi:hypothetical protein
MIMDSKNLITNSSGQQLLTESQIDPLPLIFMYSFQDFLKWWYVRMFIWHLKRLKRLTIVVDDYLSFSLLLNHFFMPWHRDYSAIGYLFGIVMKVLYLPIAFLVFLIAIVMYLLVIIFWMVLPIGTVVFIITSLFN